MAFRLKQIQAVNYSSDSTWLSGASCAGFISVALARQRILVVLDNICKGEGGVPSCWEGTFEESCLEGKIRSCLLDSVAACSVNVVGKARVVSKRGLGKHCLHYL